MSTTNGETNIETLIRSMRPKLHEGEYVFCTAPNPSPDANTTTEPKKQPLPPVDEVLCTFREEEGLTMVLRRDTADAYGLSYSYVSAWITLTVHSSLEAVGLTAAFAAALAKAGISCNVVAAYYHDHIFVATTDASKAMSVLEGLSEGKGEE